MTYITPDDLSTLIKDNVLNDTLQLTGLTQSIGLTSSTLLTEIEQIALSTVDSYIGHYFDIKTEFTLKGTNRNPFLITIVLDILLYNLSSRLTPTKIPDIRKERYSDTIKTLEKINQGKIVPNLMRLDKNIEPSSIFRCGSNPRIGHIF